MQDRPRKESRSHGPAEASPHKVRAYTHMHATILTTTQPPRARGELGPHRTKAPSGAPNGGTTTHRYLIYEVGNTSQPCERTLWSNATKVRPASIKARILQMVTKYTHCLHNGIWNAGLEQ